MAFALRATSGAAIARGSVLAARVHARMSTSTLRASGSGYGGGEAMPDGQKPHQQGPNPSERLEHPGPEAPDVGSSQTNESKQSTPQPKLHSNSTNRGEEPADVKEHNKDHNEGHDRSSGKEDTKVGKGFWKDEPGSDTK